MVKADIGNETEIGMNNIGAVQASAQSHFNNGYIHLLSSKIMESHSGGKLKERGVAAVRRRYGAFQRSQLRTFEKPEFR